MAGINNINISRVLRTLWHQKRIPRIDIAKHLNLDKSTITKIVANLIDQDLIKILEEGQASPQGGRKPIFLGINKNYGVIIGLEIEPDKFTAVGLNLAGDLLFSTTEGIEFREKSVVEVFHEIVEQLNPLIKRCGLPLLGIGIGIAGIINPSKGIIVQSLPIEITEPLEFYKALGHSFPTPVIIENDANCCCWGEIVFRKKEQHKNFMFVLGDFRKTSTVHSIAKSPAVGLGLTINGKVLHGEDNSAGELRSIFWKNGNFTQFSVSNEDITDAKDNEEMIRSISDELAANLALLVNALNINNLIIGGAFEDFKEILIPAIGKAIQRNWPYRNKVNCIVETSNMGRDAVAYGAAGMFLERMFSLPEVTLEANDAFPTGIELFEEIIKRRRQS